MAVNTLEMWSNGIKIAFFPKNLQKLASGWGLCCLWYVWVHKLLNTTSKLDICTFYQLIFALYLYQSSG